MAPLSTSPVARLRAANQLHRSSSMLEKYLERLNSGKKINRAADNAAGLAILKQLEAELRSLGQAKNNVDYGYSMGQVADGAMGSQGEIVSRMRELAIQSANGSLSDDDETEGCEELASPSKYINK